MSMDAAEILFGTPARSETPASSAPAQPNAAAQLAGETSPPGPKAGDAQAVLYGDPKAIASRYVPSMGDSLAQVEVHLSVPQAEREQVRNETVAVFNDAGIAPEEASVLHSLFAHHVAEPPEDAQVAKWETEALSEARMRYGSDLDARLEAARRWVNSVPGLSEALIQTGLGSHPRVVATMLERSLSLPRR